MASHDESLGRVFGFKLVAGTVGVIEEDRGSEDRQVC